MDLTQLNGVIICSHIVSSSYYTTSSSLTKAADTGIWAIIAIILAIVGGILAYFLFVKKKEEPKGKFAIWLKNFLDFKIMWIETIVKVFYYISTIFIVLISFSLISSSVLTFFIVLLAGPIITRLVYEGALMLIMIWRNTKDIAENTKKPM